MIGTTLQDSLARLGVNTDQKPPIEPQPPQGRIVRAGAAAIDQRLNAARYSETFQLQIETREGDRVRVDVRQMLSALHYQDRRAAFYAGPEGVAVFTSRSELEAARFEARFGLHVQGELNEQEMAALKSIFEQVGRLADEFYNGDIQGALAAAQQLRADPEQIRGLNLDMTQRFTQVQASRQAVAAYVEVARDTRTGSWLPRAAQQVDRYWMQVEQVQATIRETFRSFSLSIEFMMAGGDQREVSAIEQVHEQIAEAVGELRALLGLDVPTQKDGNAEPVQQDDAAQPVKQQASEQVEAHGGNEGATVKAEPPQQTSSSEAEAADTPRNQVEAMA